jgi:DNA mismatch endonuclease (patch repair protein)
LDYWGPKIRQNRERDQRKAAELEALGWRVMAVWQCELKDREALARKLDAFIGGKKTIDNAIAHDVVAKR